ncbi:MAG: PAS domain S-box protein [Bacteroidetes bacterium]|nr:PAS domain S-box protein [Bacteroidota bacterium]
MLIKKISEFILHVGYSYVLFTILVIIGILFGLIEIIESYIFNKFPIITTHWYYIIRGVLSVVLISSWAIWTIYTYRKLFQKRLESTETRYQDIIENSADAILTIDNNQIIETWNKGAEQIFGWSKKEIIKQPINKIVPENLDTMNKMQSLFKRVINENYIKNFETEFITKQDNIILVQLTQTVIKNELENIIGSSIIMRDITELRIQNEHMQHSERLSAIGQMAAGVAHEVGNPLTAISSIVQLLQRKSKEKFFIDYLQKMRIHINRITNIMRELVDFSRPSSNNLVDVDINNVIQSAVGLLKYDAQFRHIKFNLKLEKDLQNIFSNSDNIHQVMINLLLNSADAIKNIEDPQIDIITRTSEGFISILVKDNGVGMSKEIIKRIYEPFFTTKPVGSGTGLGLSVSLGIITKLGGTINVKSELKSGTVFTINLPLGRK